MQTLASITILFSTSLVAQAQFVPHATEPYPLPHKAKHALGELASQSDVLILGEVHGTQESLVTKLWPPCWSTRAEIDTLATTDQLVMLIRRKVCQLVETGTLWA